MTPDQLDSVYITLCETADSAGEADESEFLTRLVLLLALDVGDPEVIRRRINEARMPVAARRTG